MVATYVSRKKVLEVLGIHYQTIYSLVKRNEIETIKVGKINKYNLEKYILDNKISINEKRKICYCRVSSSKQKEDLERQIAFMKNKYPNHEIISDIGSSLNFKRKGLQEIINLAIGGNISEVVVAYKDRLARFGFDLIEIILREHSDASIKIINKKEEATPLDEMTEDIISIMNVYVAKVNGLRKYQKKVVDIVETEYK